MPFGVIRGETVDDGELSTEPPDNRDTKADEFLIREGDALESGGESCDRWDRLLECPRESGEEMEKLPLLKESLDDGLETSVFILICPSYKNT